jgi:outer membrane protein OmpA-like peptidoglycan-associated protein
MNKKCFYVLVFGLFLSFSGYAQSDSNAQPESKGSFFFSGGVYNGFFSNGPIVPIPNFEIKKLFAAIASGNYEFPMGPGNTALGLEVGFSSGSRFGGKGAVDFIPFGINAAYVFPLTNFLYAGPRVRIGGLGMLGSDWNKVVFTTGARLEAELRSANFPFGLFIAGGIDILPFAPELAILPVVEAGIRFPRGKLKKSSSPASAKNKEPPETNTGGSKDDLTDQNITASTTTIVPQPIEPVLAPPDVTVAEVETPVIVPQPAAPEVPVVPAETVPIVPPPVAVAPVVPPLVEPALEEHAPAEVTPEEPAAIVPQPIEPATIVPTPAVPEAAAVPPEPAVITPPPVAVAVTPTEPAAIAPSPVPPPSVVSPPEPTVTPVVTQAQRAPIQGITGASQAQNISVMLEDGRQGILNSIYFEPDTAVLIELYRSVLNGVGRRLAEDPSLELVIRAYAAYFGTADGRHTVSSDRAVFSMDYLAAEYGISVNRFSTEVYGADRSPKYATEDWQTHRCVELILARK